MELRVQRVLPAQAREAREASVSADPRRSVLDREGSKEGVGDVVSRCLHSGAKLREDRPMTLARGDREEGRPLPEHIDELERLRERSRLAVDPWMGHDAQETTQDDVDESERFAATPCIVEPCSVILVALRVSSMCVHEDVHVNATQPDPRPRPCDLEALCYRRS